jgi:Asp-tRNA(Asn)/Glu-tRNA(Gln) amidotransferase A subunit family amidase
VTLESARTTALRVRAGEVSAREVAAESLVAASRQQHLGALWEVDEERVIRNAERVDVLRARGRDPGPLAGVPVVIKDSFAVRGMTGDAGSGRRIVARRDAVAVARLRRAGAIVLAKAAMHQLAWGTSGQTPGRPVVRNPRAADRQPGGSSSGSAVAVAAGIAPLALGSDTAGSIRIPAAWCGVVGWKPRQAAVPRLGLRPLAATFDTVGCLARTVDDAELMSAAIVSRVRPTRGPPLTAPDVVLDARAFAGTDASVAQGCAAAVDRLRSNGASLREVDMALPSPRVSALFAAELAEAWGDELDLSDTNIGADVRDGVDAGLRVTAVEYLRARRALAKARAEASFQGDVIVTPAVPIPPPPLDAPDDVRTTTRFTRTFSAIDWPAIVVPCPGDVPAALQLAAPRGSEAALWALARAAEFTPERGPDPLAVRAVA